MKKEALFLILLILSVSFVSAYIPRIVYDKTGVVEITNPETSQTFYAELKSEPDYFKFSSLNDFNLYLQIFVPDLPDKRTDFSIELYKDNSIIKTINSSAFKWTSFHEDFTGDNSLAGPKLNEDLPAGVYTIKVYDADNTGKYVLSIGQSKGFPILDTIETVYTVPQEKVFFNKPWFSAYFTKISLFFFWPALLTLVIIIVALIFLSQEIKEIIIEQINKYFNYKRRLGRKSPIQQDEDLTEA